MATEAVYLDLGAMLPPYECSQCGWLHDESEAWGINKPNDRGTCPECGVLAHSKELRHPDFSPGELTGFGNRTVRL